MAKIYWADKKPIPGNEISEKIKGNRNSWGIIMKSFFDFGNFIGRYKIWRLFNWLPASTITIFGLLFGRIILGLGPFKNKIRASLQAIIPEVSEKRLKILTNASLTYYGVIFLELMFRLGAAVEFPLNKFHEFRNFHLLDQALEKGKGVILIQAHIGQFFHVLSGISQIGTYLDPNREKERPYIYKMGAVGQINNLNLFIYDNRSHLTNLTIFPSTEFNMISLPMEKLLQKNGILLMLHDYSNKGQLRVPFIQNKFPYLIHTPQSYISLHRKTGAVILPIFIYPNGRIGKTTIEFLPGFSERIMEVSKKYWNAPKKEFHGQVSTKINEIFYSYVIKYAHIWEELNVLASRRLADKIRFKAGITLVMFLNQIHDKMIYIIENSFEPGRNDKLLIKIIQNSFSEVIPIINKPDEILRKHKTKINLSQMNASSEILKLFSVVIKELKLKEEFDSATLLVEKIKKIKNIENY
ncbi:MAG: hypothetical protein GY870_04215 [archaeon]|nr:hypothetical protein [archaeon]